jgi:hypothetical protein
VQHDCLGGSVLTDTSARTESARYEYRIVAAVAPHGTPELGVRGAALGERWPDDGCDVVPAGHSEHAQNALVAVANEVATDLYAHTARLNF